MCAYIAATERTYHSRRTRAAKLPGGREVVPIPAHGELPAPALSQVEGRALEQELCAYVGAALARLTDLDRVIVIRVLMSGETYRAVAESLGMAPASVWERARGARRALAFALVAIVWGGIAYQYAWQRSTCQAEIDGKNIAEDLRKRYMQCCMWRHGVPIDDSAGCNSPPYYNG